MENRTGELWFIIKATLWVYFSQNDIPSNKHIWSSSGNNPGYLGRALPVWSHAGSVTAHLTQMEPCWDAAELNHNSSANMGTLWVPYGICHVVQ